MKDILHKLAFTLIIGSLFLFTNCKDDDGPEPPTPEEERLELLASTSSKVWVLDETTTSPVTLDGSDVTGDWVGFQLTLTTNKTYSTANVSSNFTAVWPTSGSWEFETGSDGNPNVDVVIRDGSLPITIDNATETKLTLRFEITTAGTQKGGRVTGIDGTYVFALAAQ